MSHQGTVVPPHPWVPHRAMIRRFCAEIPDVSTLDIRLLDDAERSRFDCQPGQFNMLYVPGVGEAAISVSGPGLEPGDWAHTIRRAGAVTRELTRLPVGATIGLRGPYGRGWPCAAAMERDVLIIAGGIGLAPLRPLVRYFLSNPSAARCVRLLYGSRSPDHLLFAEEIDRWRALGLDVDITVDRASLGWQGNVGVVPMLVDRLHPLDPTRTEVYLCGPEVMMRYTTRALLQRGVEASHIWLSVERNMQCAVGLCGHCQLGPAFVCRDGPVFSYEHVAPLLYTEDL